MRPNYTLSIEDGIRNLCLGRSLLKRDMDAGDTCVPVGMIFGDDTAFACLGGLLFYNNSLGSGVSAVLVQPGGTNTPGDIEHEEEVELNFSKMSTKHFDLYTNDPVENDYTVARGAYIRLPELPEVSASIRMIEEDFLGVGIEPADNWFPGVLVVSLGSTRRQVTNAYDLDTENFMVRYAEALVDGRKSADTKRRLEQLESVINEDYGLGGTCQWSDILRPAVLCPTPGRVATQNRIIETASGRKICWGDIYLQAHRYRITDKRPHLTNFS